MLSGAAKGLIFGQSGRSLALFRDITTIPIITMRRDLNHAPAVARRDRVFGRDSPGFFRELRAGLVLIACSSTTFGAFQEPAPEQEEELTPKQRIERLEQRNAELERRLDVLAGDFERFTLGDLVPPIGESEHGLGPAASKVYGIEQGLSIGGYGEALHQNFDDDDDSGAPSGKSDSLDFLRAVFYFGYKFDEHWVLNTELEIEHADEVFLEFGTLDYLMHPALSFRAGLLLVPMGFLSELHEPTTFLSARRPQTETLILPSTWRENGAGVHGELGDFAYRSYVINGFDAEGFSSSGLRGGRQKGSQAVAEDLAWVTRVDWAGAPGITVGGSVYFGKSGQDQIPGADVDTEIQELHLEWRWRGLRARALASHAELDEVADLNAFKGLTGQSSVGRELDGWYVELGYDLLAWLAPEQRPSLTPFARFESLDTQSKVPNGFSSDPASDSQVWTFGCSWQPIPSIVLKVDYEDFDNRADTGVDQFNLAIGYLF